MPPILRPMPDPFESRFPSLPIVTSDAPRKSAREKYGGLLYLGIGGLAVLVSLIGWFGWNAWTLRSIWTNVYSLHDPSKSEAARLQSAYELGRDPRVNQRQLWDIALNKDVPPLARYLVAEGLNAGAVEADPAAYGLSVARSEGWPDWLRLALARPLAYRAALGGRIPLSALVELDGRSDPVLSLWAAYAISAAGGKTGQDARARLGEAAGRGDANQVLAAKLLEALDAARPSDRLLALDAATAWVRRHHQDTAAIWEGWDVREGRVVRTR